MSGGNSRKKEGLLEEAAAWFARMRGPDAEASREEFERWLARGALHRGAYNRAAEVFAMGKLLSEDQADPLDRNSIQPRLHRRLLLAGIAAAFVIVLTTSIVIWHVNGSSRGSSAFAAAESSTRPQQLAELSAGGEPQSIRLADNSRVRLDAGTRLTVQYGRAERRLSLEQGSARFYVAHERRPFLVYAGGGYVVAHGTIFDVGLSGNKRVTVRLLEGMIDVSPPARSRAHPRYRAAHRLQAGQTISFAASLDAAPASVRGQAMVQAEKPTNALAANAKDFDSITLAELVQLANQGSSRPIRLANPSNGELRISGSFRIDNTDLLAERIAGLFGMAIDRRNPAEIVLTTR